MSKIWFLQAMQISLLMNTNGAYGNRWYSISPDLITLESLDHDRLPKLTSELQCAMVADQRAQTKLYCYHLGTCLLFDTNITTVRESALESSWNCKIAGGNMVKSMCLKVYM